MARPPQQPLAGRPRGLGLLAATAALLPQRLWAVGWEGDILRTCVSDLGPWDVEAWDRKGITVEDTSLSFCPDKLPEIWPNTLAPVRSLRIFRAWHQDWHRNPKIKAKDTIWANLKAFAVANDAKILLGTQLSCASADDTPEKAAQRGGGPNADLVDMYDTFGLAKMLGPSRIFGLSVGNEVDLLYDSVKNDASINDACIQKIWVGGHYWKWFQETVEKFDALGPGFDKVPLTAVFTAAALEPYPFMNLKNKALVKDFLQNATQKYGTRFAFSFNHYPYFDPNLRLDPGSSEQCTQALSESVCWDRTCMAPKAMEGVRPRIKELTGDGDGYRYWVGETGWSSPASSTLSTIMGHCSDWSSLETFGTYYKGFLAWDLTIPHQKPPDHIFYFSLRSSLNYGHTESFGLMDQCSNLSCKLVSANFTVPNTATGLQSQFLTHLRNSCFEAIAAMVFVSLLGSVVYVMLVPDSWKGHAREKTIRVFGGYEAEDSLSPTSFDESDESSDSDPED